MNQSHHTEFLSNALRGNEQAISFCQRVISAIGLWDDLLDRDTPITDASINKGFDDALLLLPAHPFYQANFAHLHPIVANTVMNWRVATAMERTGDDADRVIAFTLQASIADVIANCAMLLFGIEAAVEVGVMARRYFQGLGYAAYEESLGNENWRRE